MEARHQKSTTEKILRLTASEASTEKQQGGDEGAAASEPLLSIILAPIWILKNVKVIAFTYF